MLCYVNVMLHITVNQLRGQPILSHMLLCFSMYCTDILVLSLTNLKITQAFHIILSFAENQTIFWDFKIRSSVRITEGSDNRDSDNRGSTV